MASTIAAITTGVGGVVTTADATGNLSLLSGTTTVVAVTSTGAAVTGTLSASGVSTFAAGTALLPALTTTGDTNTGVWFPAADTIAASTAGAERLRIDSSGNVGIGTSSPGAKLDITNNQAALSYLIDTNNTTNGGSSIWRMITRNIANTGTTSVDFYKPTGTGFSILNNDTNASNFTAFNVGASEQMRIDSAGLLKFNSGYGSAATAYGCRAWVNFNGTGTVAIRASGNVSSITDRGVGRYSVNLTTAMPDANYSVVVSASKSDSNDDSYVSTATGTTTAIQTSSIAYISTAAGNVYPNDCPQVNVSIFR